MNPASWQKFLKIICIFYMVFDVVVAVAFALVQAGMFNEGLSLGLTGIMPESIGNADASVVVSISAIPIIVSQVIHFICTVLLYRGAKNPAKIKLGMILFGILSAFGLISIIGNLAGGTFSSAMVTPCVVTWIMFFAAISIYNSTK